MSSGNNGAGTNGTLAVAGPKVIQTADFYLNSSILHPFVIGSVAILALFILLRFISNRTIAPMNTFDWLVNVALGSTLAGIVNGNSLVRGLLGLATMLAFQWLTSFLGSQWHGKLSCYLSSPPLIIAFRGRMLEKVMQSHRVSHDDFFTALRQQGILSVSQVECVIIEANGAFSIYTKSSVDEYDDEPDVLMRVVGYKALCEEAEKNREKKKPQIAGQVHQHYSYSGSSRECCDEQQNQVAADTA